MNYTKVAGNRLSERTVAVYTGKKERETKHYIYILSVESCQIRAHLFDRPTDQPTGPPAKWVAG